MKIARFEHQQSERLGVVFDEHVHPLPSSTDLLALLISIEPPALTESPLNLGDVRLLAPMRPASIRDFSAFEQHIEGVVLNMGPGATVPDDWYAVPGFYFSNPHAVIGHDDPVEMPPGTDALDFELEVAAVIGRNIAPEDAGRHIAGYTLFNDWSARDIGFREAALPFGQAKGKDFASTLGPWIVTPDELEKYRTPDRLDIALIATLNGRELGRDSLANLAWSFEELIAYASRGAWIRTGDVIGAGTCGSGCLAELWGRSGRRDPPALVPGDVVSLSAQGIGTLTNRVVEGSPVIALPAAARRPRVVPR